MSEIQFVVVAGPDQGRTVELSEGTGQIVGRHAEATYRFNDPRASRRHFEIQRFGDEVKIVDYGSTSGTYVNGTRIRERILRAGDVVQMGDTQLRLSVLSNEEPTTPPAGAARPTLSTPADQDLQAVDHPAGLQGRMLAHFQIGEVIGAGASGMVFRAVDQNDQRPVALKVMHPEFSQHEEEMQRFVLAMKAMMPLQHVNLIQLYGAGKNGPYCWMSMELIEGENMAQVLERIGVAGMLDWKYAFRVAVHIGRALEYAHEQHIIHRNITPTNILMDKESKTAKLGDLMLARALDGVLAQQVTKPGQIVGDIMYMSPERTKSGAGNIDGRSDLFSLGATVYALLTGHPPFAAANMLDTITKIRHEDPKKPSEHQMGIPGQFEGVVMRLLAKNTDERFQNAGEMLAELDRIGKFNGVTV